MTAGLRTIRSHILTPSSSATRLGKRGFHIKNPAAQELLETIGKTFLIGYARAAEARSPADIDGPLSGLPARFRGFAYEGAAMGFAVVDGMSLRNGRKIAAYLDGNAGRHIYMAYIGLGWAMARLPRFRWPRIPLDPVLQWFVLDGYGFHQAYFHTDRYVRERYRDPGLAWPPEGPRRYADQAVDQGIGRALWFVAGADAELAATLVESFPESRRPDLYSGAGLAATYAGGAGKDELHRFWERAGEHRPQVAQGSAFAAEARRRAGLEVPHTQVATQVFCDMAPEQAARIAAESRPATDAGGESPAHEVWRRRIADEFASLGRC